MDLNYYAFFFISFLPLAIGYYWYHPKSFIRVWSKQNTIDPRELNLSKIVTLFMLSLTLVYGYINLIIHQMGFYELFFTDIIKGSEEAESIVQQFMSQYGEKHRHFGHGVFHGIINAFVFALPFVGINTILHNENRKYLILHFSYWLVTSAIIGGLISQFV